LIRRCFEYQKATLTYRSQDWDGKSRLARVIRLILRAMRKANLLLLSLLMLAGSGLLTAQAPGSSSKIVTSGPTDEFEVGGPEEEEESETPLYVERSRLLDVWTVNDSISRIPAYDAYCHWDTRNLFAQKEDLSEIREPISFTLIHEACDFVFPAPGHMTSPFGPRWGRMHSGLDLDLETGDEVSAAFEGMVRISQYHSSYGNVVVIRHANGLETLYAHMSRRSVAPGDYVQAGDVIGLGGNTGRSYGSHLHFEIRYLGSPIDPSVVVDHRNQCLLMHELVLTPDLVESHKKMVSTAASTSTRKFHVVRSGETLSAIARKHGTTVNTLCKLNKIKSTSAIRPGQKVRYR